MRFRGALIGLLASLPLCRAALAADSAAVANMAVIGTIPGPDGGWDYASVDESTRQLLVAHGDAVMAVDLDSGKVNPKLIDGKRLHAVTPVPDGRALTTNGGDNTATLFEIATAKIVASIPTGQGPDAAILDPASGLVMVMDGKEGDITLIDLKTATSPGRIAIGGKLEFAAADGKGRAYVNVEDKNEIAVVDVAGRKVVARYPLAGCEEPSGLAIDPATGLLVAACANEKAVALDAKDGTIAATLTIGKRPDAVIFDAKRNVFFIPCGEGNLAVIAEKAGGAPSVVATIPTQNGARTAALDPKTGKLYLPTADFTPPPPGEKRHAVVPGTFRIVVVGTK